MHDLKNLTRIALVGVLIGVLSVFGMLAQSTASITGTVSDATGAVIPGVEVSITNVGTGIVRTAVTNDAGLYRVSNLPPGKYNVKAALTGFKTALAEVDLIVGDVRNVGLKLEVGEMATTITVTDAASAVEVSQSRVSSVVTEAQIKDLPLNGRNIYQLMQIAPGVVNSTATVLESGHQGATVNGGRGNYNGFWLDGVSNKGLSGGVQIQPSVDSVQEFRIETLNFSAEYGNSAASIVTVVSKSGTNRFNGSAFWFHRNDNLDAAEFFDKFNTTTKKKDKPEFKQNQFGFTFGGPIRKNSTFFFGSYEGTRLRTGESSVQAFESSAWATFVQQRRPNSVAAFLFKNYPAPQISTVTETVGQHLADFHLIPTNSQANVDVFLAGAFGSAPGALKATDAMYGETSFFTPDSNDQNQFSIRIDQELSENDKLFGRYYFDRSLSPITDPRPAFNSPQETKAHQLAFSETHIFSPTVVNEARAALSRGIGDIFAGTPGVPQIVDGWTGQTFFGSYNGYPQIFHENVFTYGDVLSVTKGRHGIKLGAEVRRNQENSEFNVGRPSYTFYDLVYLALDDPYYQVGGVDPHIVDGTRSAELASSERGWRNTEIGIFFNDDWKIGSHFTLNLGVRWDWYSRLQEINNRATKFDVSKGNGNILLGVARGDFGRTDKLSGDDWNNFAPRIGFAWDPFGSGKTSVRAGYGIAYQSSVYNPLANSRWNPPFYSFNLICDVCGRPRENILYGPQTPGQTVRPGGPNTNPGARLFEGNIIAYDGTNNNTTFLTGIPNPNMRDPYVMSWFFGLQRELLRNLTIEANYVGTGGRKLIRAENFNRFRGDRIGAPSPADGRFAGSNALNRINPNFGNMRFWENSVNSNYNALQVEVKKRYSGGFAITGNYTWSKSLDVRSTWHSGATSSNLGQEGYSTDNQNVRLDYGRSIFDARHRVGSNYLWEMPFFKGSDSWFLRQIIGGWQINGIVALQSGQPFTPFSSQSFGAGGDFNADGTNNDRPNAPSIGNSVSSERSDWVNPGAGPFKIPATSGKTPSTADKFRFFTKPAPGTNGTLGRNTYDGPGNAGVDFSLFKNFSMRNVSEDAKFQFRFEVFNLFNRVNFFQPEPRINNSSFGRSTAVFDAREIQLGLKFIF